MKIQKNQNIAMKLQQFPLLFIYSSGFFFLLYPERVSVRLPPYCWFRWNGQPNIVNTICGL